MRTRMKCLGATAGTVLGLSLLVPVAAAPLEETTSEVGMSSVVTLESVMARTPDLARGADLYDTCRACHQADGSGAGDGSVPHIAGQHYGYVAGQLVEFRLQYRGNRRMQHFLADRTFADPQAIADVAAHVAALPPATRPTAASAAASTRGARLFNEICAQCHSNDGQGNAALGMPRIAGQYPAYLSRRIREIMEREEHYSNALVPMLLDDLSDDDIEAVAGYVASLTGPGAVPARTPETPGE